MLPDTKKREPIVGVWTESEFKVIPAHLLREHRIALEQAGIDFREVQREIIDGQEKVTLEIVKPSGSGALEKLAKYNDRVVTLINERARSSQDAAK